MQLKIKTKLPEGLKAEKREPAQTVKRYDELVSNEYLVLGMPFGGPFKGRDSDGQTFTANTDAWLSEGKEIPVTYYHGLGPDAPDEWQEIPAVIGVAKYNRTDEKGFWFDVKLDNSEELAQRITSTKTESVRASSGAVGHLVRANEDGEIVTWPVGELALFDTNEWRKPANDYAVFNAKGEGITEAKAQAETQAEAVDVTPEQDLSKEINIMEDEKPQEVPAMDIEALVTRFSAIVDAKLDKAFSAPPINAPTVIKAENLGDPDPSKAFIHYLRTGERVKGLKANVAPMGDFTAAQGGYLVPDDFYSSIIEKRNEESIPRLAGATIIQTNRDVLNIPVEGTSQTYFDVSTAEIDAVDEDEPGIGQVAVTIYPWTKLVKVSEDLLEDDGTNLNAFLASSFGRWMAMTENKYTTGGSGTNQPQGILLGGTAGLTLDDTNSIGAAEIPELYHKLAQPYRNNSSWVANDNTIAFLRGIYSSSMFTFGAHEIDNNRIMGRPYFTTTYVDAYSTGNKKVLAIGDWSRYAFVERKGITIRRLNELYAGTRQVGILATARWGGAVMQAEAFQYATTA